MAKRRWSREGCREKILGPGNSMCRNPKRGASWAILRHKERALVARKARGKQTVVRNEAEKNGKALSP